jgi:hypothetical protein
MKLTSWLGLTVPAFAAVLATSAPASADILPAPNCGFGATNNCLIFDDFTVYSMALLHYQQDPGGSFTPSSPFYVASSPGALKDALVVATGPTGAVGTNTDVIGGGLVDNAHETPNSVGGTTNFVMSGSNDGTQGANITPAPNSSTTWDVDVDALNAYLAGGQMEFFFNLNQTNSGSTTYLPTQQDALGWLAVTLTSADGLTSQTVWLDGDACTGIGGRCDPTQSAGQDEFADGGEANILPADPLHDEFAFVHGSLCASAAGAVVHLGPCTGGEPAGSQTVNQNLGANVAAFGLVSETLNTWLASGLYDGGKMSVDLRMAGLTNGFEQLFIISGDRPPVEVPEPLTIGLFGAGLIGAGLMRRRKKA